MIGAIGSKEIDDVIIFEVSDEKILTFFELKRQNSVRYAKHDILLKKPVSQYVGMDLDKLSFTMKLRASFGVDPRVEMNKLIYLQRDGTVISFVIGSGGFGMYRWIIKDLSMSLEEIDNIGFLTSVTLEIGLEEYL